MNWVHYFLIGIFILLGIGLYLYPDSPEDVNDDTYDKMRNTRRT